MRIAILGSGAGSNAAAILEAIAKGGVDASCALIVSDKPNVGILHVASSYGVPHRVLNAPRKDGPDALHQAIVDALASLTLDLIVLAGFLRILPSQTLAMWPGRIINLHPSLLPLFPGLHTHRRVLESGMTVHGCTVHLVDEGLDSGSILTQGVVPVLSQDTEETLRSRVQELEHQLLPELLRSVALGDIQLTKGGPIFSPTVPRTIFAPHSSTP